MNPLISGMYRTRLYRVFDFIDYSLVLNILKYLPIRVSERLALFRGIIRYFFDLDWRSSCLGYPFLKQNTARAFSAFLDSPSPEKMVLERFMHQSREELEGKLFSQHRKHWPVEVTYENFAAFQRISEEGKGIILLTAHFDSSIAGSVFLGDLGFNINIFHDEVVYDSRVPGVFQRFFREKYRGMQSRYNCGTFIQRRNLREIYYRLEKGEVFVWLHDVVLNMEGKIDVEFLKEHYKAPNSALKIARDTGSYIGAYVTLWEGSGRYRTIFSEPRLPSQFQNPAEVLRECYAFLSDAILRRPERWWIADTLCEYKKI